MCTYSMYIQLHFTGVMSNPRHTVLLKVEDFSLVSIAVVAADLGG